MIGGYIGTPIGSVIRSYRTVAATSSTAAGVGSAAATGLAFKAGAGLATGIGGATAQGRSFAAGAGAAVGTGAANGVATSQAAAQGNAAGVGAANAVGTGIKSANASVAAGVGVASAAGVTLGAGAGNAAGTGTAAATGTGIVAAVGNASGVGAASGNGTQVRPSVGNASGIGSASAFSFYFDRTASVLKPDADSVDGGWTNEVGGTSLVPSLDETAPNDSDYIISSDRPASDICKVSLSNPSSGIAPPLAVLYRFQKQGPAPINLRVRLLQGTTEIAAWTHTNIATDFVTGDQTLTAPQFAAISDPNNLFLEFQASV